MGNYRQQANTKDEDPTGLLNEGFRYRDLETGTFITRDPLGFVDGPSVYTYVVQNPWTKFDPLGLYNWNDYTSDFSAGLDLLGDYTIRSPRVMGGMRVLGGVGEGVIAMGLAGAPEPTMGTKLGAVYMGTRSIDHIFTGGKQVWTGEWQQTISHQAMSEGLGLAGMSPEMAFSVATYFEAGLDVFSIGTGVATGLKFRNADLGVHSPSSVSGTISARTISSANEGALSDAANEFVNLASSQRTRHILYGDATGGGHLYPGLPGKSAFPPSWSKEQVMHNISDVATGPSLKWVPQTGNGGLFTKSGDPARFVVEGAREGVIIRTIIEPAGEGIITAYPR